MAESHGPPAFFQNAARVDTFTEGSAPTHVATISSSAEAPGGRDDTLSETWAVPATTLEAQRKSSGASLVQTRVDLLDQRSVAPSVATWGMRGALVRGTAHLIKMAPSAAERAYLEDIRRIQQFTWQGAFHVAVVNKKGGVGRTPAALILGGVLASVRGGGVCVVEASEDAGGLSRRAEGTPQRGLNELLEELTGVTSAGRLDWYTQPQTSHAAVIGSTGARPQLDAPHVNDVRQLLGQYYRITVSDTGTNPQSNAFAACVGGADALVLPTTFAIDSALALVDTLELIERTYGEHGRRLMRSAVVVLTHDGRPEDSTLAPRIHALLRDLGISDVVEVPFDPHIAARGEITYSALSEESRRAWIHVAASVVAAQQNTNLERNSI